MKSKNKIYDLGIEDIIKNKISINNNKINILEIGAYCGSSSSWIIDNYLHHDESSITIIEPFSENSTEIAPIHFKKYELFIDDIKKVLYPEKVILYKDKSITVLPELLNDKKQYDIIFINGSYLLQDIYEDIEMCWDLLKINGYLFIDKYNKSLIDEIFKSFIKNKKDSNQITLNENIIVKKLI